jgi:hypothetical protein
MSAASQIVSDGGLIISVARCNDGFPAHGNFRDMLLEHDSPEAMLETIYAPGFSKYDQWQVQLFAQICKGPASPSTARYRRTTSAASTSNPSRTSQPASPKSWRRSERTPP